jgi:hypothetical protein
MPNHLTYRASDSGGHVDHWLVLGPCGSEVSDAQLGLPGGSPVELDKVVCGDRELFWEVAHCDEDHLIESSDRSVAHKPRRLWAFTRLACRDAQDATLALSIACPASLWLNRTLVVQNLRPSVEHAQALSTCSLAASLRAGDNDVLVCLEWAGSGDGALAFALRVEGLAPGDLKVRVPTVTHTPKQRIELAQTFDAASLDRAVYGRETSIALLCHTEMDGEAKAMMRLQRPDGRIYAETFADLKAGAAIQSVQGVQLPSGAMEAVLMPSFGRYYDEKLRARRVLPFWVNARRYTSKLEGEAGASDDARLVELMQEAARGDDLLYGELAKMVLGWWGQVKLDAVYETLARIRSAEVGCLPDLVGLLGMVQRMARYRQFPRELASRIETCVLGFDFYGTPAPFESDRGLLYAGQTLAGQLYPHATFAASGRVGEAERQAGEAQLLAWLRQHAQAGFALWDAHLDALVIALAHLADLAVERTVRELAAVLLDKLLFGLALHSFQGTFGTTRGDTHTAELRSGRLAAESALNRLLWGVGGYSETLKGAVSLGLARGSYQLPEIVRRIALDRAPEVWSMERELGASQAEGKAGVSKVAYKTPDYLLSSAQDWQPGQRGQRELTWQATMGPDALVYTNHPTNCSLAEGRHAAWWAGNGALPRVAQHKDALIALYDLPADDWLGFTHAHWPCYAFDEYTLRDGWAFARCDEAYLALYASRGLSLMDRGQDAYRELRAWGSPVAWLCQMGRAEVDGSLADFQAAVLASRLRVQGLRVEWTTIRGDELLLDWAGPLLLNGQVRPLSGYKHFDGPYAQAEMPALQMDILYGEDVLRLDLS